MLRILREGAGTLQAVQLSLHSSHQVHKLVQTVLQLLSALWKTSFPDLSQSVA